VSQALKETVEKLGDVGVSVNIHKPPELLDARTFTDVTLVAFVVLSQDDSTLLYLQEASKIMSYLVRLLFILCPKKKTVHYEIRKNEVTSKFSLSRAFYKTQTLTRSSGNN
jgi:hypothetical protein